MPTGDHEEDRIAEILARVDREVERRRGLRSEATPPAPAPAPAAPMPPTAPPLGPERAVPAASGAEPAAPPAPEPLAVPAAGATTAAEPIRAPAPLTPAELTSGIFAARRRLAILNAQLDELAAQITALAEQTPGGPAALPGHAVPAPPLPAPPAPVAAEAAPPEEPIAPTPRTITFGMGVRPRPPVQHRPALSPAHRAHLVAVELAVAGHRRGEVDRILSSEYPEAERTPILDSLYGPGTHADARMRST